MRRSLKIETKDKLVGLSFVTPWLIGFLVFSAFPLCYCLYMALNNVTFTTDSLKLEFLGLANFRKALFEDAEIVNKLLQFLQQSAIMIPIIVVFALLIALMLNAKFKGRGFIRSIFFLPVVLTSGNLIGALTDQKQGTISFLQSTTISALLSSIGGTWAVTLKSVLDGFLIILWYSGVQMLLLIAGMQSINPSIYEAARIDGAGKWESLWTITLPSLTPFIFISVIYTIVDQFTAPFNPLLTVINHYSTGSTAQYGYAAAISWIFFVVILLIIGLCLLIFRKSLTPGRRR